MHRRWLRVLSVALLGAALAVAFASHADAQRGRRGRRGRRAPVEEPAPPPEDPFADGAPPDAGAPTPPAAQATPDAATPPATPPAVPVATPAPTPAPTPTPEVVDPGPTPPDVSPLREEYVALMDEMVQARGRVAELGRELFQTRVAVMVQDRAGDDQTLARFVVELDGAPIYRSDGEIAGGGEGTRIHEGALAPGPHVLTLEVEQRAREDAEYRYVMRDTFRFIVVRERLTEITIVLEDDSDVATSFRSGGEGRYDVRTRVRIATRELPRS